MHIILCELNQSGTDDAIPTQRINEVSNYVDDAIRTNAGDYNMRLSDDILPDGGASVVCHASVAGDATAKKITASFSDVNIIRVQTFDANNNLVDLGGRAWIVIESPTTIF